MTDLWAYDRVHQIVNAQTKDGWSQTHLPSGALHAFARYVSEHEQPPVDHLYDALKAVVELGRYDTREQTVLLRGELERRGLALVKIAPKTEGEG